MEKKVNSFECEICHQTFLSRHVYENHIKTVHEKSKSRCETCEKDFSSESAFKLHTKTVHDKVKVHCQICDKSYLNFQIHMKRVHSEANRETANECDLGNRTFHDAQYLKWHYSSVHENSKFTCDVCGKVFSLKKELNKHRIAYHDKNIEAIQYQCDICLKTFPHIQTVSQHKKSVHLKLKFHCDICSREFAWKSSLQKHKREFHFGIQFPCHFCEYTSTQKSHLKVHINAQHECTFKFECDICCKVFKQKSHLKKHVEVVHDKIKSFKCEHCEKQFGHKSTLDTHLSITHDKSEEQCNICGKMLNSKYLRKHILFNHENNKSSKCDICEKEFTIREMLNNHLLSHSMNSKSFKCDCCEKDLTTKRALREHIRKVHDTKMLHSGMNECNFRMKSNLVNKAVQFEKIKCDICEKEFNFADNFKSHFNTKHNKGLEKN